MYQENVRNCTYGSGVDYAEFFDGIDMIGYTAIYAAFVTTCCFLC